MRAPRLPAIILVIVLMAVAPGCRLTTSVKRVARQDEQMLPVAFQSQYAQQTFHERILPGTEDEISEFSLGIPFLLGMKVTRVTSENARFNDLVRRCDTNGDGSISDSEVAAWEMMEAPATETHHVEVDDERASLIHLSFGDQNSQNK